ncbi:hypothetical protein Tco_0743454 [Tanacetum coccineum]
MVKTGLVEAIDSLVSLDEHLATFRGTVIQEQDQKESQNQTKPSTEWKGQSQSTKEIEGWDLLENHLTQQAHLVFALTKEAQAASPRDEDFGYK